MKRLLIACGVLLFGASVYLLGWSPFLTAQRIEVTGAPTPIAQSRVMELAGIDKGEQLARIDVRAVRAQLQPLTWIEGVDISRDWLSKKVTIAITPRTPIARINQRFLADDGATFELPGGFNGEIPTVSATSQSQAIAAAQLFTALPSDFRGKISQMKAQAGQYTIYLTERERTLEIRWGSDSQNALKLKVLNALRELPENSTISFIDLSAPHAPIVK